MYLWCRTVIFSYFLCHTILLWKSYDNCGVFVLLHHIFLARCRMLLSRYHNCACNISLSWCQYIVARLCYQRYRSISFGVITLAYLTYYTTSQIVFHRASSTSTLQKTWILQLRRKILNIIRYSTFWTFDFLNSPSK